MIFFVEWGDLLECCVEDDSDGPNRLSFKLKTMGCIHVRRLKSKRDVILMLDGIRSMGKLPVRLRCDL